MRLVHLAAFLTENPEAGAPPAAPPEPPQEVPFTRVEARALPYAAVRPGPSAAKRLDDAQAKRDRRAAKRRGVA